MVERAALWKGAVCRRGRGWGSKVGQRWSLAVMAWWREVEAHSKRQAVAVLRNPADDSVEEIKGAKASVQM